LINRLEEREIMSDESTRMVAATLAVAVLNKINVTDSLEATKEVIKAYRFILRRLDQLQVDEAASTPVAK
jgi:hypothetical protein